MDKNLTLILAARIAPNALITPANDLETVKIVSVGARDLAKAQNFAQKYRFVFSRFPCHFSGGSC
jgi:predicted dehydrogenase